MATIPLIRAINHGLTKSFDEDEKVILLGLAASAGSAYGYFLGFDKKYGKDRVLDMPLAETMYTTFAIGAAMAGFRPIVEFMFGDFATYGYEGIANIAAKQRYNTGGQFSCPVTYLLPIGKGKSGCTHTQNNEAWFANVPGLKVCAPTYPAEVQAYLQASVRDDDPVLFYFDKSQLGLMGEVPDDLPVPTLEKGTLKMKEGKDITLIGYHSALVNATAAAEEFEKETGLSVEILNTVMLVPFDTAAIYESVKKTGKVLLVTEAPERNSMMQCLSALIAENCFESLKKPVKRVGAHNAPSAFGDTGPKFLYPSKEDYIAALKELAK